VKAKTHVGLLVQALVVWSVFWVAGLPSYYQQYSPLALGVGCTLLSVLISLAAIYVLGRGRAEARMSRATWIAFYYTVPFALLDTLYCGVYLGRGASYLHEYWYLTVFYLTPWLTFPPTALLLQVRAKAPIEAHAVESPGGA
jgi:hypothetical protein